MMISWMLSQTESNQGCFNHLSKSQDKGLNMKYIILITDLIILKIFKNSCGRTGM